MKKYLKLIKRTPLFNGISEEELDTLLSCLGATEKQYPKGQYILRTGDISDSIGLVLQGTALILQDDYEGNRNIVAKIIPGDMFAEAYACSKASRMNVSVVAENDCIILWLAVRKILTTCSSTCTHHAILIRNLVSTLAEKDLQLNQKITHMSKRTTRDKVLSYLSYQSQKEGRREFEIPFNRQQLADYLSVERSALSAELSKLQKEGLLTFNKNRFILH